MTAHRIAVVVVAACVLAPSTPVAAQRRPTLSQTLQAAAQKQLEDEVVRHLGNAIGVGAPLRLDQRESYPPVAASMENFTPTTLRLQPADLTRPLVAGDYSIPVLGFCTQWSLHRPGQGLAYKLGRIQGRHARPIGVLLTRGVEQNVPLRRLKAAAWRIQGGLPIGQWPERDRALANQLIPEYEPELGTDYLQQVQSVYDRFRAAGRLPPFQTLMARLGAVGQSVLELRRARAVLANKTLAAERVPDLLYQRDRLPSTLAPGPGEPPSAWSEIQPGVYARLTIVRGDIGTNLLDVRVTPRAVARASAPRLALALLPVLPAIEETGLTLGGVLGWLGYLGNQYLDPLLGYAIGRPAQALILVPDLYPYAGIRG